MRDQGTLNSVGLLQIIDISSVTRPFFWIKWSNIIILATGLNIPFALLARLLKGEVDALFLSIFLPVAALIGFAAWIAWGNVSVLNAVIQPWTLTSLFMVVGIALGMFMWSLSILSTTRAGNISNVEANMINWVIIGSGGMGLVSTAAAISVIWLRRGRINTFDLDLPDFLRVLNSVPSRRGRRALPSRNLVLGWLLIVGGSAFILGVKLVPDSIYHQSLGGGIFFR